MQHHFAGIIFPESEPKRQSQVSGTSRRTALKQIVGTSTAALALSTTAFAKDAKTSDTKKTAHPKDYNRFVVVPKDFRKFRTQRRKELGIGGSYFRLANMKDKKRPVAGFLTWTTDEGAEKLADQPDVLEVRKVTAKDVPGPGANRGKTQQLMIRLNPNGWRLVQPPKGSYVPTDELIDQWSKQFKIVKFKATKVPGTVLVNVGPGGMPEDLLTKLKDHRQVVGVYWNAIATTLALGEEGATTKALGEEGGVTTKALGEEGASTRRLGEEGATTQALGEEGGVTTKALGEEGGRPPKRPITQALKETGKRRKVTTLALGEEGGKKK